MAFVSAVTGDDSTRKFMDVLQNDFKTLSLETKKKYPQIREACDEAIEKLSLAANNPQASLYGVVNQILYPLVQGCESKDVKIIKFCLGTIQRLIAQQGIDAKGARHIVDCLFNLGQANTLELKLLQTAALLMTTSDLVHGDTLARTMVLCMKMVAACEGRDVSTSHAAAATVRQLVALVFERALAEADGTLKVNPADVRIQTNQKAPKDLKPCAVDAYLILQDIIQLINGDAANWLVGISDVPKTFGLELLDTVLTDFSPVFFKITEFRFLLKEHVCALIIRLFSPNVKYRAAFTAPHIPGGGAGGTPPAPDRPHFPVTMRLLRLVSIILHKYHDLLVTECEIFLSLTIKFLDPDKPLWQRALALEVLHKMTIQPDLLKSFCECYDMRPHATNIFQDIVNALGAYVQSLFVAANVNTQPGSTGVPQQAGFYWKGVWLPLCVIFEPGTAKSVYIEMLDRTEAPTIQDGYGISVAYACLIEIIRSIAISVEGEEYYRLQELYDDNQNDNDEKEVNSNTKAISNKDTDDTETRDITKNGHNESDQNSNIVRKDSETDDKDRQLSLQLIKSSWCGLVWGLSVLAEASIGELENILCAIQTLARVSGKVGVTNARDACIGALCRCALPAQYCVPVLGALAALACPWPAARAQPSQQADLRHHVVWVGTPLPCAQPPGQQQSFVMVTSRHVTAMRALLQAARRDGDTMQQAWLPVLTTLQHLVWILGLKPSTGGSMKASRASADANAVMSTSAVMADLPGQQVPVAESLGVMSGIDISLSAMLSRVFEASKNLDDVALHHLIDALCKLSNEAMDLAYSNREPSLFAVAKLLETGLANMHRIEVMWRPITNHLLEVCQHPHIRMREWGVEAITYLVQAAFQYHHNNPALVTEARERLILEPLAELCNVRHCDVRARQLECAARLLHSRGEQLGAAWPLMMEIISAICDQHSEQLVRSAFQCAQLVAGDLLGCAGPRCLRRVLAAAAAFARQTKELNISLTAVGLMWNISDYLYHKRDKLSVALANEAAACPEYPDLPPLDRLWMCLYVRLSELCTEPRAPVRRAASQTLFSCIGAHGTLLSKPAWRALLNILFPMLQQVQKQSNIASSEKVDTGEHILIHHTRNTAQKQWAETQVLTLSGVSRVFHSRFQLLTSVGDFQRSWTALLDFIVDFALRKSHEVSVAALKSFQEVVTAAGRLESESAASNKRIWAAAWAAWTSIASNLHSDTAARPVPEDGKPVELYSPSLNFLTTLVQIFPLIFQHIRPSFTPKDVEQLGQCLCKVCSVEPSASALDGLGTGTPASLHALHCLDTVHKEALVRHELLPAMFSALTSLADVVSSQPAASARCLSAAAALYRAAPAPSKHILPHLLQALHTAVKKCSPEKRRRNSERERDQPDETAQIATLLLQVLATGLPLAREKPDDYKEFWEILPGVLETFMFEPPVGCGGQAREVVCVIRDEVLGGSPRAPAHAARRALHLVRAGSMHANHASKNEQELREREEFARACFETLLQFSMLEDVDSIAAGEEDADPLAIMPLLDRFQEVISKYSSEDDSEPLTRHQLSEISFVLKAIATLTDAMKRAPPAKVDATAWQKLIGIYPLIVGLAAGGRASGPGGSGPAVREALLQFGGLLAAPP
ncbi:protein MON2 homolog isoform X1 [Pieris rapae]|uniref:protein MON2 homolog isoform X1 n=1 Tax=Pieris rapae TaxID=64459 RepID=UPI001E2801A6|nr:protein MON2 homolog isoform X1 [Pieris rapae]